MAGLLIAAQVQEGIAVADNRLPLLFKQSLQLCHVLNDDRHRDLSASHGGQQLIELIREGYIGELVHEEMHMNRKPATVDLVSLVV